MNSFVWGFKATMGAAVAGGLILLGIALIGFIVWLIFLHRTERRKGMRELQKIRPFPSKRFKVIRTKEGKLIVVELEEPACTQD